MEDFFMRQVNFDAPAILEKAIVAKIGPGRYAITHVNQVAHGSLTECLYHFQQKPDSQKPRYNILTNDDAGIGKCTLDHRDIELLAQQPNYPLRGH
jgi:hypothetical protein